MLEAMAYYNSEKVVDLYYETTLKLKRLNADDNKAEEMLDIIFSNRIIDLANIYNWEDCIQYYNQLLVNNSGVVSFLEARQGCAPERNRPDGRAVPKAAIAPPAGLPADSAAVLYAAPRVFRGARF